MRNTKPDCYLVLCNNSGEGSISVMDRGSWKGSISVMDWCSLYYGVDGLGVGVGGWGIGVFHDGLSLNLDVVDDWCSGDNNFVWDWDSNWFLDINGVRVDSDLSWVVVYFVEEGGRDSNTWSEYLWFVDDRRVTGDLVLNSVMDGLLDWSCEVWDWLSYVLLDGGVVTLNWD